MAKKMGCRSSPSFELCCKKLHLGVQQGNAIDLQIEVRSGTVAGLSEVTVLDGLGVAGVVGIGVNIGGYESAEKCDSSHR